MKSGRIHILLLFLLLCISCRYEQQSYPPLMERAVQLMETHPDSALACLDSLSISTTEWPEELHIYYLLLTVKAKDKLYIPVTSDTLINRIISFYEDKQDDPHLMEAYYYKGSAYRDMKDAPRAVDAFLRAAEIGKRCFNDTLNGRIYGQLASLFAFQRLYHESMEATQQAYKYNLACHNYKGMAFGLRDMARIYDTNNQKDSAEIYYRKAYTLMKEKVSLVKACSIGDEMAGFYYNQGKTDSAEIIAKQVQVHHPSSLSYLVLGEVYYQRQMFDSASIYLQKVIPGNNLYHQRTAYRLLHLITREKKQYPEAHQYASLCINAFDSLFQITKTEEVNKIHSLYNYNLSEQENQRLQSKTERQKLLLFQLLFVASLLIGIVIYLLHRLRERRRKYTIREQQLQQIFAEQEAQSSRRILENEQQITLLNEQLQSAKLENDTFKHSLLEAQAKRLGATNEQIRAIRNEQEMRLLAFRHSDIYLHFHHATQSSEITERDWKHLSEAINSTFPNFLRQLYALYPQLSEHELHICYLIKIELKRSIIAELLNRSVSAITNSLSRLYQKIYSEKGTAQQMEGIIQEL